jgi:hypothetical protein
MGGGSASGRIDLTLASGMGTLLGLARARAYCAETLLEAGGLSSPTYATVQALR